MRVGSPKNLLASTCTIGFNINCYCPPFYFFWLQCLVRPIFFLILQHVSKGLHKYIMNVVLLKVCLVMAYKFLDNFGYFNYRCTIQLVLRLIDNWWYLTYKFKYFNYLDTRYDFITWLPIIYPPWDMIGKCRFEFFVHVVGICFHKKVKL